MEYLQHIEDSIGTVPNKEIRERLINEMFRIDDMLYEMSSGNEIYHEDDKLDKVYQIEKEYKDKIHLILDKLGEK